MDVEVTVITAAYNAASYIEKCIQSVLAQTAPCRMIIVDDASSDMTLSIARQYAQKFPEQIKVIANQQNMGAAAARNLAVQSAATAYVAILDADDWWQEDKIALQLARLRESGADACYSGRELMQADGSPVGKIVQVPQQVSYKELLKGNVIPCSSVLLKREDALRYPMVHDELHEDYIVWLSMLRDGRRFVGINEPLLKSRLGEGGKSRNKGKSAKMTYGVYRYMGIPSWKAVYYFCCYAVAGVRKYMGKS
jgi:teichuronic acid biosynthesis glycosyltransferase TuaG